MSNALWVLVGAAAACVGLVTVQVALAARGARRCSHERRVFDLERLQATVVELRVGDASVLGPMTLGELALCIKYGGVGPGGDLLAGSLVSDPDTRIRLLAKPPPEPLTGS